MKKIIILNRDNKFLNIYKYYESSKWETLVFHINDKKCSKKETKNIKFFKKPTIYNLYKIIKECNSADLVITNGLSDWQKIVVSKIKDDIIIIWRFFGFELYSLLPNVVFGPETIQYVSNTDTKNTIFRNSIILAKNFLKIIFYSDLGLIKVTNKINYFQGISKKEYEHLNNFFELPPFIDAPLGKIKQSTILFDCDNIKLHRIIIGNNRSVYNNYLELFDFLIRANVDKYNFDLLINYGDKNKYYNEVINRAKYINNLNIIDDFIDIEAFNNYFISASAYINNGYRQMSAGTINFAIINGLKIYLSNNNIYKNELLQRGYLVYSIEDDLESDLRNTKITLSREQQLINYDLYVKRSDKYSLEQYHEIIEKIITKEQI
jgi:hypothetical protein